jgi:hypothetical protein
LAAARCSSASRFACCAVARAREPHRIRTGLLGRRRRLELAPEDLLRGVAQDDRPGTGLGPGKQDHALLQVHGFPAQQPDL